MQNIVSKKLGLILTWRFVVCMMKLSAVGGYPMENTKWTPKEYTDQEVLSLDRLKRAVLNRVFERAEYLMGEGFILDKEKTAEIIAEEWQRAKKAVMSSPAAAAGLRKQWEDFVTQQVDGHMKADKEQLLSFGVAEKSI